MNQRFPLNNDYNRSHFDTVTNTVRECTNAMIDKGLVMPRWYVRKLDTIDVTRYAKGRDGGNEAALPEMKMSLEESTKLKEYWCLAVPPLLYASLVMNKARYLVYEVSNIDLDNKAYDVSIVDYGYENNTWQVNAMINAHIQAGGKSGIEYQHQGMDMYDILKAMFIDKNFDVLGIFPNIDKRTLADLVTVVLPWIHEAKQDDFTEDILNHFVTAIIKVNCELQRGPKPKAVRTKKSGTKVKTVTDKEPDKNPKPQIVRTLASGVTIKSEKIPKAPTVDIIRHYKIASWSVRGHMRHYKNGKAVYIMPSVHKRKEFENKDAEKRQTIIISGRRN